MFYKGYQIVVNVKTAVHKVGQAIKNLYNLYMSPFIPDTLTKKDYYVSTCKLIIALAKIYYVQGKEEFHQILYTHPLQFCAMMETSGWRVVLWKRRDVWKFV